MLKSWRKMKVKGNKRKQTKSLAMENTLKKRKRNNINKSLKISREKNYEGNLQAVNTNLTILTFVSVLHCFV